MDQFLEACGQAGPLILDVEDPDGLAGGRRVFHQPFVLIGRKANADLSLDHWEISRRHAFLQIVEGRLFVIDLDSRTGISWDDGLRRMGWLGPERPIRLGPFFIRPQGPEPAEGQSLDPTPSPLSRAFAARSPYPTATLEICHERQPPMTWTVNRSLTLIGGSRDCALRIKSRRVAQYHCALLRTRDGLWLVDLLTHEGTIINGTRLRAARLADGDEIQVGTTTILVKDERAIARVPVLTSLVPSVLPHAAMGAELLGLPALSLPPGSDHALMPFVQQFGAMQQQMFDQFQQMMMMMAQIFGTMHQEQMSVLQEELEQIRRLTQEMHDLKAELLPRAAHLRPSNGSAHPGPSRRPTPAAAHRDERLGTPEEGKAEERGPNPPGPSPVPDKDIHAMISQRLAEIDRERQGRWQKIMAVLKG
jgi:pSer/pThr/pTyr-binding forkhead associated (FHA) protein